MLHCEPCAADSASCPLSPPACCAAQFQDVQQFNVLFTSAWPTTTITAATDAAGNTGSTWNYGASATNDMMGIVAGSTPTDHSWPGSYGVTDSAYGTGGITLCPGTAGAACSG